MALDAVLRNFAIIGEATGHIPGHLKKQCPTVPWKQVRRMRNVVVHEYFGVDLSIIWQTVHGSLPVLKQEVKRLLDQLEKAQSRSNDSVS